MPPPVPRPFAGTGGSAAALIGRGRCAKTPQYLPAQSMRIAQVAPLHESCPPPLYGGTERVVSYLTEELVRQGHEVTLFASGDSRTAGRLVAGSPRALRLDPGCRDPLPYHMAMLGKVARAARQFDILHFHTDYLHFPLLCALATPALTTLHGRLDLPDLVPVFAEFAGHGLVSISDSQRLPARQANWLGTVHHGLPPDLYPVGSGAGGYLAFLGRISPEKRPDRAIAIARAVGLPLRIAAKVDKADRDYFDQVVRPLLADGGATFIGEIAEEEKAGFLGQAAALLFPIDWPEPFGIVTIEAMACGTPVIAFRNGAVPEVVEEGVTGFVVESVAEAVAAVGRLPLLDRRRVRRRFEERFTTARMARDYLALYERLLSASPAAAATPEEGAVAA